MDRGRQEPTFAAVAGPLWPGRFLPDQACAGMDSARSVLAQPFRQLPWLKYEKPNTDTLRLLALTHFGSRTKSVRPLAQIGPARGNRRTNLAQPGPWNYCREACIEFLAGPEYLPHND
jgi:hypothetical protein